MPKPIRQSPVKAAPFSVKRKQINFNLLDGSDRQASEQLSLHRLSTTFESKQLYDELLKEKDEKISQLKKDLDQSNQEIQLLRHTSKLMENERSEYEREVQEKCEKDKQHLTTELKILKETHIEKVQNMSTTMNNLQLTIASLREQLKRHDIKEEQQDTLTLLDTNHHYKNDAQFIQDAYSKVKQDTQGTQLLWSTIQETTNALRQEINTFQVWKSLSNVPVHELSRLMREERHTGIRKVLFGATKKSQNHKKRIL
ncbi:hypothetical protein K501DRAFT_193430 [Backusella circina FSU 941]|nr:hypothetical protein K501DRAFT_193462 [Backusella circina FSU 941]KAI8879508.1 hypothetical protein K501DRAFT_193430 [Backusella circina FSU 941]